MKSKGVWISLIVVWLIAGLVGGFLFVDNHMGQVEAATKEAVQQWATPTGEGKALLDTQVAAAEAKAKAEEEARIAAEEQRRLERLRAVKSPEGEIPGGPVSVEVSLGKQIVYVFLDNQVFASFYCSAGIGGENATPVGRFFIEPQRGTWYWSKKYECGIKYWISFAGNGEYLFHSTPTDKDGNVLPYSEYLIGTPASHGCIRLSEDNALWFYNNVPTGAPVDIYY